MAENGTEESVLLHLEKRADWGRPMIHGMALALSIAVVVLAFQYVSLHPFLWIFIAFVLAVVGISIFRRSVEMRSEKVTVTLREIVVEKGGEEKRYVLGPSTKVHLDSEVPKPGQRYGPLKEISFANKMYGDALITKVYGWTQGQVDELFQLLLPFLEPRAIVMSFRFKRYLALIQA